MRTRFLLVLVVVGCTLALPAAALADSIYGECRGAGGEKCESHHRISTSWNSSTGKINTSAGSYELDFGGTVGATVTVYCDGTKVGTVRVNGRTRYDVVCR